MRTKTQHHLPRMYLKAWAQDDRVAFRRRDTVTATVADTENVGAVNLLHTDEAEQLFGKTENAAAAPLKRLAGGDRALSDSDREALALFVVELMSRQPYMATFRGLSPQTFTAIVQERRDTKAVLRLLRSDHGITRLDAERLQDDIVELFHDLRRQHAAHDMPLTDAGGTAARDLRGQRTDAPTLSDTEPQTSSSARLRRPRSRHRARTRRRRPRRNRSESH